MELATRSWGLSLAPPKSGFSASARKVACQCWAPDLGCFSVSSSWRYLSQNSVQARCRPSLVLASKSPDDDPASKAKTPSAADAKSSIERPAALNDGQAVNGDVSKKVPDNMVTREQVLKACVNTSAALAATGLAIRQATHYAVESNWSIPDCYVEMPYAFESWHLGATAGTVVFIASLRQILLSSWPEFSRSSRQSNEQVLSPLRQNDYLVVSLLPGISEELLFRGAILPLVGVDWRGVAVAGVVFGVLHISGGRNAAFAAWASFVGVVYGLAAISTTNLAVPMVAHSVANLVAAYVWRIEEDGKSKSK